VGLLAQVIPLPFTWKLAAGAIGLLIVGLMLAALYAKGRSDGSAACQAAVARAVVKQQEADKALSDKLLNAQRQALDSIHGQAMTALQRISSAPVTDTCGETMREASKAVRALLAPSAAK